MDVRLEQDYQVYKRGDMFVVRGDVDGEILCSEPSAVVALQTAVDALQGQGGMVRISRGIYPLKAPLQLASNILLRGSGRGTRLLAGSREGIMCQGCKGSTIADLEILPESGGNNTAGIVLDDCGDCQVHDVYVHGFTAYGIWMRNNSFLCELNSCKLAGNGKANIYLENLGQGGRGGDFVPNLIANCITYGGHTGIECKGVIVLNIVGSAVFQPAQYAYYLHHTSNSVLISGCRSFQAGADAVVVESTHELNITGNIFCWHRGHGIVLRDVSWGTITGNELIDQGVRAIDHTFMTGLVMKENTRGMQVTGNTIFNWGDQCPMYSGIEEDQTCRNNSLVHNNINYYIENAVNSVGLGTLVAGNIGEKNCAYQGEGRPPYPDFTTDRLEHFIRE